MRIYKNAILFGFITFIINACDVVNIEPISTLSEIQFFHTAKDLNGAVLGIYSQYQSRLPRDWTLFEMPTDHLYMSSYRHIGGLEALNNLNFQPQNDILRNFWQSTYNGIYRANAVLANLDKPTDYKGTMKVQLEGEARFMRALFYFDLVRIFGGVPKVTSLLSITESSDVKKSTSDEIYDFIISDLANAVELLPKQSDIARGRACNEAAIALLGKVYIYIEDWENALTQFDKMSSFNYKLLDNYSNLWEEEYEDNSEVIFAIKYIANENGHSLSRDFLPYFGVEGFSSSAGGEIALPTWDLIKKFEDGDSRKYATITEYWKAPGTNDTEEWRPYVSKFLAQNAASSGLDIPVLRFADILLLKSEALYHLDKKEKALIELNKVRIRAFGNSSHNYSISNIDSKEKFVNIILLERQLEFAYENQRWVDLIRMGRMQNVLSEIEWGYNPKTGQAQIVKFDVKPHFTIFPIPQDEIDLFNPGVLDQNPGYN